MAALGTTDLAASHALADQELRDCDVTSQNDLLVYLLNVLLLDKKSVVLNQR